MNIRNGECSSICENDHQKLWTFRESDEHSSCLQNSDDDSQKPLRTPIRGFKVEVSSPIETTELSHCPQNRQKTALCPRRPTHVLITSNSLKYMSFFTLLQGHFKGLRRKGFYPLINTVWQLRITKSAIYMSFLSMLKRHFIKGLGRMGFNPLITTVW